MDSKQFERKNFVVGNINLKYEELQQLLDQMIHTLTVQLPNNFRPSNKKKFIKFKGCAFQYYVNGKIETVDNVSIDSNIANTSNRIGITNNISYSCFKQNPNKCKSINCKHKANCNLHILYIVCNYHNYLRFYN
jgi:hypothetical protein